MILLKSALFSSKFMTRFWNKKVQFSRKRSINFQLEEKICINWFAESIYIFPRTAWKVSKCGVFLVHIFWHLEWVSLRIQSIMQENRDQKKLRIWTLFTQWQATVNKPKRHSGWTCLGNKVRYWKILSPSSFYRNFCRYLFRIYSMYLIETYRSI